MFFNLYLSRAAVTFYYVSWLCRVCFCYVILTVPMVGWNTCFDLTHSISIGVWTCFSPCTWIYLNTLNMNMNMKSFICKETEVQYRMSNSLSNMISVITDCRLSWWLTVDFLSWLYAMELHLIQRLCSRDGA
jgi:hypothetical protein